MHILSSNAYSFQPNVLVPTAPNITRFTTAIPVQPPTYSLKGSNTCVSSECLVVMRTQERLQGERYNIRGEKNNLRDETAADGRSR